MATYKEPKEGWLKNTVHVEGNEWLIQKHHSRFVDASTYFVYHYHPKIKSSGAGIRYEPGYHRIKSDHRCEQCDKQVPKHVLTLLYLMC